MKISLLNSTKDETLGMLGAAICVGKEDSPTRKGMMTAIDSGHHSILEHISFTFLIKDISRACSHQLVRHRLASYSQQSQRYAKINTNEEWYIEPESIVTYSRNITDKYRDLMSNIAEFYQEMISKNIPNEDARMILPNACFTSIMVSMNARSLVEAATLRTCNRAQWEIRQMFKLMRDSIKDVYPHVWEKCFPNCTKKCGCLEAKPCGNPYEKFSSNK